MKIAIFILFTCATCLIILPMDANGRGTSGPPSGFSSGPIPFWWYENGVLTGDMPDDFSAFNQGQLKHVATQAYHELEDHLPGGAGQDISTLINSWDSPGPETDDFAAVNLGQLKNVAALFYDRLIAENEADDYPWANSDAPADDFKVANIGQLKYLFSFDLQYPKTVGIGGGAFTLSAAQGMMYHEWIEQFDIPENEKGFTDEPQNDGVPNLLKFALGLSPEETSTASLPEGVIKEYNGDDYLAMKMDRPVDVPYVRYIVEGANNLNDPSWRYICDPITITESLPDNHERVWLLDDSPVGSGSGFLQLRIMVLKGEVPENAESLAAASEDMTSLGYFVGPNTSLGDLLLGIILADTPNMTVSNVRYEGALIASDCFSDGLAHGLYFDDGIVLTTGYAKDWNETASVASRSLTEPDMDSLSDKDLENWMDASGYSQSVPGAWQEGDSVDTTSIEFDFVPDESSFEMRFQFASEEYFEPDLDEGDEENNPAQFELNDAFAVFIGKYDSEEEIGSLENIGLLPVAATDTPSRGVSVFNVGETILTSENNNLQYWSKNSRYAGHYSSPPVDLPPYDLGYSGFTDVFVAEKSDLVVNDKYFLKIVIADHIDPRFDSAVFLEKNSLKAIGE